jgi:hypothetical protein
LTVGDTAGLVVLTDFGKSKIATPMKKLRAQWFLAGLGLLLVLPLSAQDMKLKSGSLEFLKGEKTLNVEYVYDGLTVGNGTEQAYIEKKVAEFNTKEPGKGEKWLENWKSDRSKRYQPKFEELLNKQFTERKVDLKTGQYADAKYTLVLKTLNLEPGYNAFVSRAPAQISTEAKFVETKDRSKELAVISILKAPGSGAMGYDYDPGYRLQEGYAKTGKELGKFLCQKALK